MLEVGDVGTHGVNLERIDDVNRFNGDLLDGREDRINPNFGVLLFVTNGVSSTYHALTTEIRRELSGGLSLQANYRWSKWLDTSSDTSTGQFADISDAELAATTAAQAAAKEPAQQSRSLGLGMANSQRAMLRAPALSVPWRAYGNAARQNETVGRDIKLQVSFAVSVANECRYCTLHQVLGLRRLGVDPGKLLAMRKDDSVLTPREQPVEPHVDSLVEEDFR
jgi:hypothetical protein